RVLAGLDVAADRVARAHGLAELFGRDGAEGLFQGGLDGAFGGVIELFAVGREELDAVVVVRVVRGRDDDAAVGAHRVGQVRDRGRGHRPHQLHVDAGGHQPGLEGGLEHVVGDAGVLADDHHRLAPGALAPRGAQRVAVGVAQAQHEVGGNRALHDALPISVGAEVPAVQGATSSGSSGAGCFISSASRCAMRSRISRRSQIWSMAPCSSRNSERWKPSGRVSRTVCSITRGPAKPICAPGSAMLMSPSIASEADTPPVVGLVITEMYGSPAARNRPSAAEVLAICISENRLSCIRAPPLAEKQTRGAPISQARSAASAKRSPTTEPIDPPMNAKSNAQATIGRPASAPSIATSASRSPLDFCAALIRSEYFFWSLNFSTSTGPRPAPISVPVPSSRNAASLARARIFMWWPHFG